MDPRIPRDLQRIKSELHTRFGVKKIGCFDCYIKHHHNRLCDINILVELDKPLGWKFFALKEFIEKRLQLHIDIFTDKALKPALKEEIISQTHFV